MCMFCRDDREVQIDALYFKSWKCPEQWIKLRYTARILLVNLIKGRRLEDLRSAVNEMRRDAYLPVLNGEVSENNLLHEA